MILQNILIAIRRILRNFRSNLLIFIGLVIGLTSSLVIYTKIKYELSFDRSHSYWKNTYRVVRVTSGLEYNEGGLEYRTGVHFPFPAEIKKSIPELENVVTMLYLYGQKINIPLGDSTKEETINIEDGVVFTESSFFEVFNFGSKGIKWLEGEGQQVLNQPFQAVLTEKAASQIFKDQDPLGKDIVIMNTNFNVGGVISDFPENTDFPFKVMLSLPTFFERIYPGAMTDWGSLSDSYQCYVVLNKNSDPLLIEKKFKETYSPHADGDYGERRLFKLQQLSNIHRESKFGNYHNRTVSTGLLMAIGLVGSFIFLISCFNYSNFFLAETAKQNRQIALRMIMGSKFLSVYFQFLCESLIVILIALVASIQLSIIINEHFSSFLDIPSGYFPGDNLSNVFFIILLIAAGAILSTVFAFVNFKIRSLSLLLKTNDPNISMKNNLFGKSSVILQFIVAQVVIIATLIILKQIYYINHKDLGYSSKNIIYANLPENQISKLRTLKSELLAFPFISQVGYSSVLPSESQSWTNIGIVRDSTVITLDAEVKSIDTTFLKLYSFSILSGNNFSTSDSTATVIVNMELLNEAGYNNAGEAIGQKIQAYGNYNAYIKGVVDDFNSGSLHDKIRPCVFLNSPSGFHTLNIRLAYNGKSGRDQHEILAGDIERINRIWNDIFPGELFGYKFLSDRINEYYRSEYKALNLFLLFGIITILLCILGILGLSLSINEKRTKEIGIRKVTGANTSEILALLNRDFIKWVLIAFILAVPVALVGMHKWLENFAYRTNLSWWIFVIAGLMAILIVLITVTLQSWRAATRNPVEALRYE
jgi:putative ABC transport system permease protein